MTTKTITAKEVWEDVNRVAGDIIEDMDQDSDRDSVLERCDEEADVLWCQLSQGGMIQDYRLSDMVETLQASEAIIRMAQEKNCVETDTGLWEGVTYGLVASIAYYSLRNLLYQAMREKGVELNDDRPLLGRDPDDGDDTEE